MYNWCYSLKVWYKYPVNPNRPADLFFGKF